MKYLLDTNVLSEATRTRPDPQVSHWLAKQPSSCLFVSVMTVAEIRKGILLMSEGKKRRSLEAWLESELLPAFSERILPLGDDEMRHWSILQATAEKHGNKLPVVDSLIAATARCHNLIVATRNANDFHHSDVPVINPWLSQNHVP